MPFCRSRPTTNKPTPEGPFSALPGHCPGQRDKPIVLYSIPGRCGVEIAVSTVQRLLEACPKRAFHQGSAGGTVFAC